MKLLLPVTALAAVVAALPAKRPFPVADSFEPIAVGPAIVDFPVPLSPVVIGPLAPGQPTPLVQIIVNVNDGGSPPIVSEPVLIPEVKPVIVVDQPPVDIELILVVEVSPVEPIQVVEVSPVEPIQVIEVAHVEPVIVTNPVPTVILY